MAEFVRCKRLRDRDYFDADYDVRFDPREQHICLFHKRMVIPSDECKSECPGYVAETKCEIGSGQSQTNRTTSNERKSLKLSREAMRKEIQMSARSIAKHTPTEEDVAAAKARAEEAEALRQEQIAKQLTPVQQMIRELEADLLEKKREMARSIVIREMVYRSSLEDVSHVVYDHQALDSLANPLAEALSMYALTQRYASSAGVSVKRNPLAKEALALYAEIQRLKQLPSDIEVHGIAIELDPKQTSSEQCVFIEMSLRRNTLRLIVTLLETTLMASLETCSDPMEIQDVSAIRRFLEIANKAVTAPAHELAGISSRLHGMRLR